MKRAIKYFGNLVVILFSLQAFAEDTIKITVSTTEKTAAAPKYTNKAEPLIKIKINLIQVGSMPKKLAKLPHTPAAILSLRER